MEDNLSPPSPPTTSTDVKTAIPLPSTPQKSAGTNAVLALILGILALTCCGFFTGIPAILLGRSEIRAFQAGQTTESGKTRGIDGMILGIVGTVLWLIIFFVYLFIVATMGLSGLMGGR